jgi:hypothetical protein
MVEKNINIGIDRFLALEWANYSLELFLSSGEGKLNYQLLTDFLQKIILGKESARKTSNQLRRLWLNGQDDCQKIRSIAREILVSHPIMDQSVFHFGMALNVYPIFKETCNKIGSLSRVQGDFSRKSVIDRVTETYVNPTSVPRIVARVVQTLIDWKFLIAIGSKLRVNELIIEDDQLAIWFILALMNLNDNKGIVLTDFDSYPEKIGVRIINIRKIVHDSELLVVRRNSTGIEYIEIKRT